MDSTTASDVATSIWPTPLLYGSSFVCHPPGFNAVRFLVESRTRVFYGSSAWNDYLVCASCKSEDTFADSGLFYQDNYDFRPIFGGDHVLIFRRRASVTDGYREVARVEDVWGRPRLRLRNAKEYRELETWDEVWRATDLGIPVVSQTQIADPSTGYSAVIECPVKTLNVGHSNKAYQVDTGPLAFPDLSKTYSTPIQSLSLGFIAFNRWDSAEFILERPTPVIIRGSEVCKVYHYSNPFEMSVKNRLLAVEG